MINIAICDDDCTTLENYSDYLKCIAKKSQIDIKIKEFTSGEQLVFHLLQDTGIVDIIYLDIMMSGLNGIETAKKMRNLGCQCEIIFLTSREDYVFESFDITPMHYLLKEKKLMKKFEEVFLRAVDLVRKKKKEDLFVCEYASVKKCFPVNAILYFEIKNHMVTVHCMRERFTFYSQMDVLCERFESKGFVRVHRSFLVNLQQVKQIERNKLILLNGALIPVGRVFIKDVRQKFLKNTLLEVANMEFNE